MSETSVLTSPAGKPVWDVTKTTAFPVDIQVRNQPVTVYVYMTPYTADELKDVLKKAVSGYRRDKRDVEIEREDRTVYTPLCDNHFVKLGNSTGTPESQRAWLDRHPELKPSFVEFTFGGLRREVADTESSSDVFDIDADLSGEVAVYQDIFDPATDKVVRVDMVHRYANPTEQQHREFRSAHRNRFVQKRNLWTIGENYNMLERLYDQIIQSVDGIAVNGKKCETGTKSEWVGFVPLWHKLAVVDQAFSELVGKNA